MESWQNYDFENSDPLILNHDFENSDPLIL
jgi:hypothetical protein